MKTPSVNILLPYAHFTGRSTHTNTCIHMYTMYTNTHTQKYTDTYRDIHNHTQTEQAKTGF